LEERDKLHLIAEAAVKKTIIQIRKENQNPKNYYALNDPLNNNAGVFKNIEIGDGTANICYNYDEQSDQGIISYGVSDEERKININEMELPVLERLLRIVAGSDPIQAQELAASIIDWRDEDSELSIPSGSAEDQYYRNLEHPYEAKDAKFEVLEEVLLVKGMSEDIFTKIKKYITIYGDDKVNINTAPRTVLLALGLNGETTDKILNFRCGNDGLEGTADDNTLDNPSDIALRLSKLYPLTTAEMLQLDTISERYLTVNSYYFMIEALSRLNNRKNTGKVVCIVDEDGKILYWQEP
jgi:type II secretory pathway component PulK